MDMQEEAGYQVPEVTQVPRGQVQCPFGPTVGFVFRNS